MSERNEAIADLEREIAREEAKSMAASLIDAMVGAAKAELMRQACQLHLRHETYPDEVTLLSVQGTFDLRALMRAAVGAMWMPMESAPKDGTEVLVCGDSRLSMYEFDPEEDDYDPGWHVACWSGLDERWINGECTVFRPTAWMPLPPIGER